MSNDYRLKPTHFAFHNSEEIGPGLLGQIAKKTGLRPEDL